MANEKKIKTRIQQKHDLEVNWTAAGTGTNPFIPMAGEVIVYDRDDNYSYERFKIGDGKTKVHELPFAAITPAELEETLQEMGDNFTEALLLMYGEDAPSDTEDPLTIRQIASDEVSKIPDEIYVGDGEMPEDATIQIIMDGVDEEEALTNKLKDYTDSVLATHNVSTAVHSDIRAAIDGKSAVGHTHTATEIASGTISPARLPVASGTTAGVTIVYPEASCTTFTSDEGTITPLAAQKAAKMFAVTRPTKRGLAVTDNAVVRWDGTGSEVKNSNIRIEDVTNTVDTNKKANVLVIPAEGGKKMVYGYCTDQTDGTSFIGGVFPNTATSYPYSEGLAIGGTSGNLLWKGKRVITADDLDGALAGTAAKATADADGNVITSTYATKTELSTAISNAITTALNGSYS